MIFRFWIIKFPGSGLSGTEKIIESKLEDCLTYGFG
jgi:hypothetical protein